MVQQSAGSCSRTNRCIKRIHLAGILAGNSCSSAEPPYGFLLPPPPLFLFELCVVHGFNLRAGGFMLQRACQSLPAGPSLATNKTVNRLFITQFTPFYNNVSRIIWPNLCIQNTLSPHFCPTNFVRNHYSIHSSDKLFRFHKGCELIILAASYLILLGCKSVWGYLFNDGHHYLVAIIIRILYK